MEIDKNVPLPEDAVSRKKKYPFDEMEVGDSFAFHAETNDDRNRVMVAARSYGKRKEPEWKFISRKIDSTHSRIWRVK